MKKNGILLCIILIVSIILLILDIILLCHLNNFNIKEENINIIKINELNPSISEYDNKHLKELEYLNALRKTNRELNAIRADKKVETEEYTDEDLRYLSCIIYCEANNQCLAGKQAVGIVVMNRVDHNDFENSIKAVIHEPGQFSPVEDQKLNKALKMYDNGALPQDCISAAEYALSGETSIVYNGEKIDMKDYLFFARYWENKKITIQDHDFK